MAKLPPNAPGGRPRDFNLREDGKHLLASGGLVGAVIATLILGAVLRDADRGPHGTGLTVTDSRPPARSPIVQTPAMLPGSDAPSGTDIEDRAREDARRLAATGGEWTLQFLVTCVPETPAQLLNQLRGDEHLYLLPVLYNDEACLRICWGSFFTREAAVAHRRLPAALDAINPEPIPRPIRDVIP